LVRQEFKDNRKFISAYDLNKLLKHHEAFLAMPAKTSQMTIMKLGDNWISFFRNIKHWSKDKSKYCGRPDLPRFKKKNGRFIAFFDKQQIKIENNLLYFQERKGIKEHKAIYTNVKKEDLCQIQIIPEGGCYKISIIYNKEVDIVETNNNFLAIDIGVNNLATLTNNIGIQPIVINGRVLKSINAYYSKIVSQAMAYVGTGKSNRITRISDKRNRKIEDYMHKTSRWIINYCKENNINNIVIGRNSDWKRDINIGVKNNQIISQIPFEILIQNIQYKAEELGILVEIIDERYTSKSSFLDNDPLPEIFGDYVFSGKRIKRGLYKSSKGILINADVNASYNILRKRIPEFKNDDRIKGMLLYPININI
jgi:putative transposase